LNLFEGYRCVGQKIVDTIAYEVVDDKGNKATANLNISIHGANDGAKTSDIIAAIDWITEHHIAPSVINMSLGGKGVNRAELEAIRVASNKGIVVVVSAGSYGNIFGGSSLTSCSILTGIIPEKRV